MIIIWSILHNTKLDTWHPIYFRPAPMPGGWDADLAAQRYRSGGHLTEGYATFDEAQAEVSRLCAEQAEAVKRDPTEPEYRPADCQYAWGGEGVPALTAWFGRPRAAPERRKEGDGHG
jgi:hypothetical protein